MPDDETMTQLQELVTAWYECRRETFWHDKRRFEPVDVPARLLPLITDAEPYRGRVLADASHYLSLFCWIGLGTDIEVMPCTERCVDQWDRAISALGFAIHTSDTMEVSSPTSTWRETWDLIVVENGCWKVASLWGESARGRILAEAEAMKQVWNRRSPS